MSRWTYWLKILFGVLVAGVLIQTMTLVWFLALLAVILLAS